MITEKWCFITLFWCSCGHSWNHTETCHDFPYSYSNPYPNCTVLTFLMMLFELAIKDRVITQWAACSEVPNLLSTFRKGRQWAATRPHFPTSLNGLNWPAPAIHPSVPLIVHWHYHHIAKVLYVRKWATCSRISKTKVILFPRVQNLQISLLFFWLNEEWPTKKCIWCWPPLFA